MLGLMILIVAGLAWFFVPVRYEAFALLKVSSRPPSVLDESLSTADDFSIFKRTQVQLLLSRPVLERTVVAPQIARLSAVLATSTIRSRGSAKT